AQLGGPSREARPGYRARSFALGAPGGRGGRAGLRQPWPRLLLDAEHLLLALAGEQRQELLLLDRLALDEDLGDLHQIAVVLGEDVPRALVRGLDDPADLVVDLARYLIGVVGLGRELAPEERLTVIVAEHARPELVAHSEPHDHLLGRRGHLLDVVGRAGRDLAEHELLG